MVRPIKNIFYQNFNFPHIFNLSTYRMFQQSCMTNRNNIVPKKYVVSAKYRCQNHKSIWDRYGIGCQSAYWERLSADWYPRRLQACGRLDLDVNIRIDMTVTHAECYTVIVKDFGKKSLFS